VMPNGSAINGPIELRQELLKNPESFVRAMTEKLLMYSVNRPLEYYDISQVRKVVRGAKKDNYTLASLVMGIVQTDSFRKQGSPRVSKAAPKAAKPVATAAATNNEKAVTKSN
jgi:hypothetical protein